MQQIGNIVPIPEKVNMPIHAQFHGYTFAGFQQRALSRQEQSYLRGPLPYSGQGMDKQLMILVAVELGRIK